MSVSPCDLVRTLMESTTIHAGLSVPGDKNRDAYVRAMRRCYYLCSQECAGNNMQTMRRELVKLKRDAPRTFNPRFEIFSNVKRYYLLGIEHSLDIVNSIVVRFETGYSSNDEVFVRSILGRNYEV